MYRVFLFVGFLFVFLGFPTVWATEAHFDRKLTRIGAELFKSSTQEIAAQLKDRLDTLNYDTLVAKAFGPRYMVHTVDQLLHSYKDRQDRHAKLTKAGLTKTEVEALDFLLFGEALSAETVARILGDKLLGELLSHERVVLSKDKSKVRLKGYVAAYTLPKKKPMYLMADFYSKDPTAVLSETSNLLLARLMAAPRNSLKGVGVDFGSGVGIQAIGMLLNNPDVKKMFAAEIDLKAAELSSWNASLNGVSDRLQIVDNGNTKNLDRLLLGKKLDFAVSNPPFNVGPDLDIQGVNIKKALGSFGAGGDKGLDVTGIFLNQAGKHLKDGGEFLFYSELAYGKEHSLLEEHLKKQAIGKRLTGTVEQWNTGGRYGDIGATDYAFALANFLPTVSSIKKTTDNDVQKIENALKKSGVHSIAPGFVRLKKRSEDQYAPGLLGSSEPPKGFLTGYFGSFYQPDIRAVLENRNQFALPGGGGGETVSRPFIPSPAAKKAYLINTIRDLLGDESSAFGSYQMTRIEKRNRLLQKQTRDLEGLKPLFRLDDTIPELRRARKTGVELEF